MVSSSLLAVLGVLTFAAAAAALSHENADVSPVLDAEFVKRVNADPSSTWTAEMSSHFSGVSLAAAKHMMGTVPFGKSRGRFPRRTDYNRVKAPESFDARKQWPGKIGPVLNQGSCGSCWAFGCVESVSDRMAISGRFANFTQLSANQMASCNDLEMGCEGGELGAAWGYAWIRGLTTADCMPYLKADGGPFETCARAQQPCLPPFMPTPACVEKCVNGKEFKTHHLEYVYEVWSADDYMQELMESGPFEVTMTVLSDFVHYKSGVYIASPNATVLGGHAIKIIGWGVDTINSQQVPYWLIQNSWTTAWGLDGLFKIGRTQVGINDGGTAGKA
jgi:cathepsin B